MSNKDTVFYRANKAVLVDFTAEEISSDGSLILLKKLSESMVYSNILALLFQIFVIHFTQLTQDSHN